MTLSMSVAEELPGDPPESQPIEAVKKLQSVVAALYARLNLSAIRSMKPFTERCYIIFSTFIGLALLRASVSQYSHVCRVADYV